MLKLLLLTLVALVSFAAAQNPQTAPPDNSPDQTLLADNFSSATPAVPANGSIAGGRDQSLAGGDDICYRIRAYIFKRDDDHAPKFVGSTTCGPRQPRARSAVAPKAHFEPLK
jgi:hypothetical protein